MIAKRIVGKDLHEIFANQGAFYDFCELKRYASVTGLIHSDQRSPTPVCPLSTSLGRFC